MKTLLFLLRRSFVFMLLWIIFVFCSPPSHPITYICRLSDIFAPLYSPTPLHCNAAPSPTPRPLPYCRGQLPGRVRRQPRRLVPVRWSRGREASRPSGVSDGARRRNCSPDLIIATMKVSVVGTVMDGQALLYRHTKCYWCRAKQDNIIKELN